jgi:hypothetical protein
MIQLKLFRDGEPIFIDLYETEPIKLTLSIEDITTADASSVFSKTFRVPATRNNSEFFNNAFEIDGIDYDVTVKKRAEILVDGAEFKQGHIRLQKIYINGDQDKIDYELLFLGETRDFSSIIAEKKMCELVMTNFNWDGLPNQYSNADDFQGPYQYNDIVGSWNAYPENTSLTAGYADGDIIMPLIDHGNTYDEGDPEQGTIALGATGQGIRSFTHMANSLSQTRMKPMIRAKRIWDQIFEDAGYTYSSTFLNSDLFHQMYLSAFGNNESIGMNIDQNTTTVFSSVNTGVTGSEPQEFMYNDQILQNVNGSFNSGSQVTGSYFVCPGDASLSGNYYIMEARALVDATYVFDEITGDYGPLPTAVQLMKVNSIGSSTGATVLATGNFTYNGFQTTLNWDSRNGGYQPLAGDILQVFYQTTLQDIPETWLIEDSQWQCTAAPGNYYSPLDLDCDYNQIDYIKDVLTMFRLVMQPDAKRPNNFIIEPWQEFIGSGNNYDWSHKINLNKDQILEPLFNTQSAEIEFTFQEDDDLLNKFHQDNNKHAYGWLRFNSNNELLKGKRDIEVTGIAPTPIDQINSFDSGAHSFPKWVLPNIIEVTGENFERLAIKPKSRFLFYNGKQDIAVQQDYWYLNNNTGSAVQQQQWPLVSPYSDWPVQQNSLNLNFSNDTRYYISPNPGTGYFDQGSTLYDAYWSRYINSLYNKFSRRLTATFTLNNVDLQDFAFNDVIFINGKYFRPEKIIDVEVGATTEVKVQLITLKDQRPVWLPDPLDGFSAITFNNNCIGEAGNIQVTTNGTPDFNWELTNNGANGLVTFPVGQAPYSFIIDAPVGIDTLTVTDSLGRTAIIQVDVPQSSATPIQRVVTTTNPTDCNYPCNGTIDIVPSGGAGAPYEIAWNEQDDEFNGFNLTGICPGQYLYNITDSAGCVSDTFEVILTCNDQETAWQIHALTTECNDAGPILVTTIPNSVTVIPGSTVITLNETDGCYRVIDITDNPPIYSYLADYVDCEICQDNLPVPANSWYVEGCDAQIFTYVPNNTVIQLQPGNVVHVTVGGVQECYEVKYESPEQPLYLVDMVYQNCEDCNADTGEYVYFVEGCNQQFGTYSTSTNPNIPVGTVMKFIEDGTIIEVCVTIGQRGEFIPNGVIVPNITYDDCNDCLGISPDQYCTELKTGDGNPADGTYIFNGSTFTWSMPGNSKISICAEEASVVVLNGNPGINVTVNSCTSPSNCDITIPTTCRKLLFGNDGDQSISYEYTNCDGQVIQGFINPGITFTDCVRTQPQPEIGFGGTITDIEACE